MKVHDLQQFLKSLAHPLTSAGGKKVAEDLERAAAGLNQFGEMSIADFCGFLDKANHFVTTGQLPPTGGRGRATPRTAAMSEADLRQKTQRLLELYERALDQDFSYTAVKEEVQSLAPLKVTELKQIARELNITRSFRRKEDILEALERHITERRASHERTQGRPAGHAAHPPADEPANASHAADAVGAGAHG